MTNPVRGIWVRFLLVLFAVATISSCGARGRDLVPPAQTWGELRAVRGEVKVKPPGEKVRRLVPRERLVDGEEVQVPGGGLAWVRRDAGATLLVRGPARLTFGAEETEVHQGRVFIDSPGDGDTVLSTKQGALHLLRVRASLEVAEKGDRTEVYVLAGEVRSDSGGQARAGERLVLEGDAKAPKITTKPATVWTDWTGGLATTDREAEPPPFGVGTVGARPPGDKGAPRVPLSIQRMEVRVTIEGDLAITEVDELFFNGSAKTVEGIYSFRTPLRATLTRFGVDRDGVVIWGRVKEKKAAAKQYAANVYEGSKEDPALLEWDSPGVYRARLYPIRPGESRRVVVRYSEWLNRTGERGERRLYVFPMAAEGSEDSLPRIEFFGATFDLERAAAKDVRVGMRGVREKKKVVVRAHDLIPRADLAMELFDGGVASTVAYRAPHVVDSELLAPDERAEAREKAAGEKDYVLIPLRATDVPRAKGGLDLVMVVDTSAATDSSSLSLARAAVKSIMSHMGGDDRAMLWAGDASLHPVVDDWKNLRPVDEALRRSAAVGLATIERGGATDLGGMLAEAATQLDPSRRGAVIYIGDGRPTVGELALVDLQERLDKLARPVRIFALGLGHQADMGVLNGITRAGFAERLNDGAMAARTALRLLESAERPAWLGVKVDLGTSIERVYPRNLNALVADESMLLVGRLTGKNPSKIHVTTPAGKKTLKVVVRKIVDQGDMRARWANGRLQQMLDEGTGRAALVDLGVRSAIITPFTSLYVPTRNEMTPTEMMELRQKRRKKRKKTHLDLPTKLRYAANPWHLGMMGCGKLSRSIGASSDESEVEPAPELPEEEDLPASSPVMASATVVAAPEPGATAARRPRKRSSKGGGKEGGTGTRAKGEEGSMGNPNAEKSKARYGVAGPPVSKSDDSREVDAKDATEFGMIGLLDTGAGGDPDAPTAPWGRDDSLGRDPLSAQGNTWGDSTGQPPGDSFGVNGLGLSGIGEGGGGKADKGIGLGSIGTIGHGGGTGTGQGFGSGHGRLGGSHRKSPPRVRMGATTVTGRLPPEVIQRIVRQNYGRFRLCYENGLRNNPNLQGRVSVRFVIGRDGAVSNVGNAGSDMPDPSVVACVTRAYHGLTFPQPEGGIVTVTYPILFSPSGGEKVAPTSAPVPIHLTQVNVTIDLLPHQPRKCPQGRALPFNQRVKLWKERLGGTGGQPVAVANVFKKAIALCEAPTWRERSKLLSMMLDAIPSVSNRVELWRHMASNKAVADTLYRYMLARVRTPAQMRELHKALGLRTMDAGLLEKLIKDTESPQELVKRLSELAKEWPNDFNLGLRLLDAHEDAKDDPGAREAARRLRGRPDADAHVRTSVGELYLRMAKRAGSKEQAAADEAEARRAFGEIVEFAPDEPIARRRLGDLLRAHGWHAEARRQYETLARLSPDDASVQILMASTANGLGKLEEAVKWTEKLGQSGAPGSGAGLPRTARIMAATFLAWGRVAARKEDKTKDVELLKIRTERLLAREKRAADTVRVVVTWSHPELHPTLWSNALGAMMPAQDGDATLGIAQVLMPKRAGRAIEVRLEPDDLEATARLGATAVLTVIFNEGGDNETIVTRSVAFQREGPATLRFDLGEREVTP